MVRVDGVDGRGRNSSLITVRGLDKKYQRGGEEIHVLQGLNLDVEAGEFVAFMGPSGSGKTTLLNLLGGLDVPSAGSITVAGDEITSMSRGRLTEWRARHVGFVFQMYNLIPVLTAFQHVELPLLLDATGFREHKIFPGKLIPKTLPFVQRASLLVFRGLAGDFRDWTEVRLWADGIAGQLTAVAPGG